MLRKLSLAAVLAASMFASFGRTSSAEASNCHSQPPVCGTSYGCNWNNFSCTNYCVYVYNCQCGRWQPYRQCGSLYEAQRISYQLRSSGYTCTIQAL